MALQYSTGVRNAQLDALESAIGTGAVLKLRTGAPPATVGTADAGTVLATLTLPTDWMGNAAGGVKGKAGTWSGTGSAAGTAAHFRIYASDGTTAHIQGTVGASGADLNLDNTNIAVGQAITISQFDITAGNA